MVSSHRMSAVFVRVKRKRDEDPFPAIILDEKPSKRRKSVVATPFVFKLVESTNEDVVPFELIQKNCSIDDLNFDELELKFKKLPKLKQTVNGAEVTVFDLGSVEDLSDERIEYDYYRKTTDQDTIDHYHGLLTASLAGFDTHRDAMFVELISGEWQDISCAANLMMDETGDIDDPNSDSEIRTPSLCSKASEKSDNEEEFPVVKNATTVKLKKQFGIGGVMGYGKGVEMQEDKILSDDESDQSSQNDEARKSHLDFDMRYKESLREDARAETFLRKKLGREVISSSSGLAASSDRENKKGETTMERLARLEALEAEWEAEEERRSRVISTKKNSRFNHHRDPLDKLFR